MKTQSQVEFEAWAVSAGYDTRHWFDGYHKNDTQLLWAGWSARDDKILELSLRLSQAEGR